MDDCINRQETIDAAIEATDGWDGKIKYDRSGWNKATKDSPSVQPKQQHGKVFKGIVVEYLSYCPYPEYIGKPYFSIKYTENEQEFIGYGTYKLEVLSEYLIKYFMPSAQPEDKCSECDAWNKYKNYSQEQRWIPVSERLPNTNGIYIVTRRISDGFECRNITDACYFDGSDTWHDDTRINHKRKYLTDVLAWMPLPEPYREEGEER